MLRPVTREHVNTMLTPTQRSLRARCAAYALHAQGGTSTKAGTAAFLRRFEIEVNPDGTLPPEESARRAEFARRAHMARLALRSSRARPRKAKNGASVVELPEAPESEVHGDALPTP